MSTMAMSSDDEMRVEVIHKETIQPSSPTPHHLKTCKLSYFDQSQADGLYISLLLFYPNTNTNNNHNDFMVKNLKKSLSEALTHFYPFAGTIFQTNNKGSITCNDRGVAFLEAQVNCPISKILDNPDYATLGKLVPTDPGSSTQSHANHKYLVLVQANLFKCGALVIGVRVSHKLGDLYTLSTFITRWAEIALANCSSNTTGGADDQYPPQFGLGASIFPLLDFVDTSPPEPSLAFCIDREHCVTRRFVFDASKMAALKSKAASTTVPNPTRLEAVSALIWKCLMELPSSKSSSSRKSRWFQAVNMRKILVSSRPLADKVFGNVVWVCRTNTDQDDIAVQTLVAKLRKGIEEFKANYGRDDAFETLLRNKVHLSDEKGDDDIENYLTTSWCRFPFYSANFGWGKPSWMVAPLDVTFRNLIQFRDARDGVGIEVCLTLTQQEMAKMETNQDLLAYASLNPRVVL